MRKPRFCMFRKNLENFYVLQVLLNPLYQTSPRMLPHDSSIAISLSTMIVATFRLQHVATNSHQFELVIFFAYSRGGVPLLLTKARRDIDIHLERNVFQLMCVCLR